MQYVINSIINIDKEAENYEEEIKEEIQKRKKELSDDLSGMESEFQAQLKELREQVMVNSIKEAEMKAKSISEEKNAVLQKINEKFLSGKKDIVNSVFEKIINS